jgi:PAS domain S-box-containing protein
VILEANLTAANVLGVARGALVKHSFNGFILKEDQDDYYRRRKRLFESYEPDTWELRMVKKDGTTFWAVLDAAVAQEKNGEFVSRVMLKDMTERHKLLDNMQRIDKLDSLGVFAGGIAHDFNNLLAGIFGYLEMAQQRSTADKTVSKYLDKALSVFERAKDLTHQLLTFSKGGAPKRKTGHLGKLVKENAVFVLSGTNVSFEYSIPQDLWLADYDENQIGQVIDNIVLNAQQAMPLGGTIVISVNNISLKDNEKNALNAGNYIKTSITDTGIGIPQDLLKSIFDPFFTTKQKGTGLGLATCFSIVQKHDGCIDVESVLGKGSTFHIYLPATQKGTIRDISQSTSQHKGTGCFLVMDDEGFMREIIGDMLTDMGYTIIEAKNGEEALQLCAEALKLGNPISGALFDLTIPGGMCGKEAIMMLRKKFSDMPVFASSGFSDEPIMASPTEFGFTDSIRKPFKKDDLAKMLNKHLKNAFYFGKERFR